MVPAEQKEILRVLDLVRQQQTDHLETLLTPVHVVAEEQVVRLGGEPAVLKQAKQVRVLAVDVAADLQRRLELQQARLRQEDLAVDERNDGGRGGSGKVSERFGAGLMTAATIAAPQRKKTVSRRGPAGQI